MDLTFCGAAREVTGSCHLITLKSGFKILLDCGLYQGKDDELEAFNTEWHFNPKDINLLILSHAHIDHAGRIPKLVKDGFNGPIVCTHATRSLANIMLKDSARIQESDAKYQQRKGNPYAEPLYTVKDANKALRQFIGINYDKWYTISANISLLFRDAGHVIGSANVTLEIKEKWRKPIRLGFTGDIGRPNRPILKDPTPMPEVDYLICESTYGDKEHSSAPAERQELLDIIQETCVQNKGKLIIPAFSIGRTQELVYMLDQMSTYKDLPQIPVYIDSPLAINATDIFAMHPECFDDELNEYIELDPNPWGFKGLRYTRSVKASKAINNSSEPAIIISSSGMANAGRIRHHIRNNIENPNNTVLIVGYCSPRSTGGQIRNGAKHINLFRQELAVNAQVRVMDSFSAHADRLEVLDFIRNQADRAKNTFLVHGTYAKQLAFKDYAEGYGFDGIEIPELYSNYKI